jgi:hypothetical protein
MSDIAQVLLLPPPPRPPVPVSQEREPVATASGASAQEQARARRFRFRVYEGGEAADAGTQYDARRTGDAARLAAAGGGAGGAKVLDAHSDDTGRSRFYFSRNSGFGGSSAFVAQSIAQEQLGEGLHNPPHAAAAAAYTRAGTALAPRISAGVDLRA